MLVAETIARIRRAYFAQEKSIKAICRELHVSRKVVRKVLRDLRSPAAGRRHCRRQDLERAHRDQRYRVGAVAGLRLCHPPRIQGIPLPAPAAATAVTPNAEVAPGVVPRASDFTPL